MQENVRQRIIVLGSGNFGTCLGHHLGSLGHSVSLWTRSKDVEDGINSQRVNPRYLSSIKLSPNLHAFSKLDPNLFAAAQVILLSVPTQSLRATLQLVKPFVSPSHLVVCAAKGIEIGTDKLPSQIVSDILGKSAADGLVSLSGPSFAIEVAEHLPTGVSMASKDKKRALWGQEVFHSPFFRVYTSDDPIGLEVAGALKNVIAIGAGACVGLGFQANSLAALITRGLAEMTRVGVALGANPLTFNGLGGVGDLFLTCSSEKSRNYTVGYLMGKGATLDEVLAKLGSVAEGVTTTKSAYHLGNTLGVSIPITTAIYQVLYEGRPVREVVRELITRNARDER